MRIRGFIVALVAVLPSVLVAAPASAGPNCNDAPIPALYKKITGEEMIHCPW